MQKVTSHFGFSLIELSIVLAIFALFVGSLLGLLNSQRDAQYLQSSRLQLDNIQEALIAFAMINGRLPCPARPELPESSSNAGQEDCSRGSGHGVLPWAVLALPQLDPWGQRYTYYASPQFTAPVPSGALSAFGMDSAGNANIKANALAGNDVASALPVVIVCHGQRSSGAYLPSGQQVAPGTGDELENTNADLNFVSHSPTPVFDDQLIWISGALLKARLVAAGRLP